MSGVRRVKLGDVAEFVRGITFKPDDVISLKEINAIGVFRTKNVQAELDQSDVWGISADFVKRNSQFVGDGDILISSANSWNLVGKCCWIPMLGYKATFGGFISVLRSKSKMIESRFLYRWFSSEYIQSLVRSFGRQTTNISNLDFSRCEQLEIPLPPLEEQRRIAAILDQADTIRRQRRAALEQFDDLAQSLFRDMFGDPLTNSKGWNEDRTLGELTDIVSGITKGRKLNGAPVREVPYMAVANVQDRHLKLDTVKTIEATEAEIARYRLELNDLLLTEGGDPDKLGRGTLWADELPECIHQNHVFRVRLTSDALHPVYLNWLVGSERGKRYFLRSAKQTTGIASINMGQLRQFPLLLPPLALQQAFAERVRAIEALKEQHRAHLAQLDTLFASLQHRAFSGEL